MITCSFRIIRYHHSKTLPQHRFKTRLITECNQLIVSPTYVRDNRNPHYPSHANTPVTDVDEVFCFYFTQVISLRIVL